MIVLPKTIKECGHRGVHTCDGRCLESTPKTIKDLTVYGHYVLSEHIKSVKLKDVNDLCLRQLREWQQEHKKVMLWKNISIRIRMEIIKDIESRISGVLVITGLTKEEVFK